MRILSRVASCTHINCDLACLKRLIACLWSPWFDTNNVLYCCKIAACLVIKTIQKKRTRSESSYYRTVAFKSCRKLSNVKDYSGSTRYSISGYWQYPVPGTPYPKQDLSVCGAYASTLANVGCYQSKQKLCPKKWRNSKPSVIVKRPQYRWGHIRSEISIRIDEVIIFSRSLLRTRFRFAPPFSRFWLLYIFLLIFLYSICLG
jgi:hypothetical protein